MRPLSAAKWIHYTSPIHVFYSIEFPKPFLFFLEHFILTKERGTHIAINTFLSACFSTPSVVHLGYLEKAVWKVSRMIICIEISEAGSELKSTVS